MLFDIQEPGHHKLSSSQEESVAIGIDLGTTNSLVAYSVNQQPKIIADKNGNNILPSIISYFSDGTKVIGNAEKDAIVLSSIKRFMGKGIDNFDHSSLLAGYVKNSQDSLVFDLGFKTVSPIEASAEIFKSLKQRAEQQLQKPITQAVVTVPAYFDDGARAATKHAAHLAGLHVLRLINEPTAAALAYGLDKQAEGKYVIYDLGGGTFDVSVLNMQKGVFQVLATGGDVNLGGDDIDYLLVDLFKKKLTKNYQLTIQDLSLLHGYARKIKESFSNKTEVEVNFNIASEAINFKLSYQEFESLILPTIERTLTIVRNVMHDGKIKTNQIKGVVLVGGSTRVKLIKTQLDEFFQTNCLVDINPDEVVALGAAIQAESLTKGSDNLLIDVTPLSLGLEIMGGLNEKVIDRNTPLPISVTKEFTTYQDGQTAMWFHIVQGERDLVKDCRSLARFELRNIPAMKAGIARIIVNFTIDADGMLTVSAEEMTTASKQIIDIKPSYGLSPDQIETMLIDAMNNVDIDVTQRLLIESKVNAMGVINILNKATKEDPELLSNAEFKNIENQIQLLQQYIDQNNRDQIEKHLQQLENLIKDFSDRKMNKYIKLALRGKNITEIDN